MSTPNIAGTDVMIFLKIFAEKFSEHIGVFCSNYSYIFWKKIDHNISFWEKKANFLFAENWQKNNIDGLSTMSR
jgi:hypothetical protein